MIFVDYEKYDENSGIGEEYRKGFQTYNQIADWIFENMRCDYSKHRESLLFPQENEKVCFKFRPVYCDRTNVKDIYIHRIIDNVCGGIVFSDGRYTAGQTHISKEFREWLNKCVEQRNNPTFNFIE